MIGAASGSTSDTSPYRAGGYMIVRATERQEWMSADLLPARVPSASECICPHFPESWAYIWPGDSDAYRRWMMEELGIPTERLADVVIWLSEKGEESGAVEWPNSFLNLENAREFIERFAPDLDLTLLGLAIHSSYLPKVQERIDLRSRAGFWAAIDTPRALAPGGEPLGFELLGHDSGGSGHSWICNGVERTFYAETGIQPNAAGLLPTQEAADACLAYIDREQRAEPVPWFPWLLLRYPPISTAPGCTI